MMFGVLVSGLSFGGGNVSAAQGDENDLCWDPDLTPHSYPHAVGYFFEPTLSFLYSIGSCNVNAYNITDMSTYGDLKITARMRSYNSNESSEDMQVFLQRWTGSSWVNVSHFGFAKNSGIAITKVLTSEYGGKEFTAFADYRLYFDATYYSSASYNTSVAFYKPNGY